jgi:hypothetical protein
MSSGRSPGRRVVTKESNSSQNGKKISRKGAKLAKKGHIIWFQNQDLKISFASFAALREMPFAFNLLVPACPG